jgi:hypothetical protein
LRNIKQIGLFALIAVISFGLGWWAKDIRDFANGVKEDANRLDSLKKSNPFFLGGVCNEQLADITFYSPDNVTGGFKSTTLKLQQTGQLYLIDSSATLTSENNAGGVYSWTTDTTAIGVWCSRNKNIYLKIQKDDIFLQQTFLTEMNVNNGMTKTGFPTILVFSEKLDTIYINKTPCIKVK